ncbi:PIN-like domain-containing protein [Micromonospora chalcea]|uniref:PIN-like domain-containing protein n=1 Tax=Micromonospora TaxID=1873 RepID=UPI0011BF633D|nr:PIN-like domain-containing protein [Micromonospora sp. LHW51205]
MSDQASLGGLYDGFEGYRNVERAGLDQVLRTGIVALDTNLLLDLYRYSKNARMQVLSALEAVAPALFMPAQVQKEFWRNRDDVIRRVIATNSFAGLQEARKKALAEVDSWAARTTPGAEADEQRVLLDKAFAEVIGWVKRGGSGLNLRAALRDVAEDPVLGKLRELFEHRVGRPFPSERLVELIAVGRQRFARRMPPGYMDADKPEQQEEGTGDFLLWEQLIQHAAVQRKDLLFVTRDRKEDWWRLDAAREPIGPRVELINEMSERAGVGFFMAVPEDFLAAASAAFDVDVSESTLDTTERLAEGPEQDGPRPWTRAQFEILMSRLEESGYPLRAAVLREAAQDPRGFLPRKRVYELGEYPEGRLLVGFTRPVIGATRDLVATGGLPEGLEPALRARYVRSGKADGFVVPRSIVDNPGDGE